MLSLSKATSLLSSVARRLPAAIAPAASRFLHGAIPMDGCEAAGHIAYGMSDHHGIFPITPASPMGEHADAWCANGKRNMFGHVTGVTQMESELGVAGFVHGASISSGLVSTFTSSQGLLLMIPNLYRLAGGLYPAVFHVAARTVAGEGISIYQDHSDVMACRASGMAMLCSNDPQEAMDFAAVAHLAANRTSMPFMHFFDGFRTSHEVNTVKAIDYKDLAKIYDWDALREFRARGLNPEHPDTRGTIQSWEQQFQNMEAAQPYVDACVPIVEQELAKLETITGRAYKLFDYVGHPEADRVIVMMGSGVYPVQEMVQKLNAQGERVGIVKVHLFRPFSAEHLIKAIPATAKKVTVLDRTREAAGVNDPLYLDVNAALPRNNGVELYAGRYGIAGKEFTPTMAKSVFDNMKEAMPRTKYLINVNDDILHRHLPHGPEFDATPEGTSQCIFWGIGADGTVGANKKAISMIVEETPKYGQGYFVYSAHKSGGVTVSHLRFGDHPQNSSYQVGAADYIACHNHPYIFKFPELLKPIKENGTFVLNSPWSSLEDMEKNLPNFVKKQIAKKNVQLYNIDASRVAKEAGLAGRINMVMQSAFFSLSKVLPEEKALGMLKDVTEKEYGRKGRDVVEKNWAAIDQSVSNLNKIDYPAEWADLDSDLSDYLQLPSNIDKATTRQKKWVEDILMPMSRMMGNDIPASAFDVRGIMPNGISQFEKRGFSPMVSKWANYENCSQCNLCSVNCPHAAIRPFLFKDEEVKDFDPSFVGLPAARFGKKQGLNFRVQVSPHDCTGCGVCVDVCEDDVLELSPIENEKEREGKNFQDALTLPIRSNVYKPDSLKGSQFNKPAIEFSGACGGCGQTSILKMVTQQFGDQLYLTNTAGCSCVWLSSFPLSTMTSVNEQGHGPAYAQGLFEDAAEFGYGVFRNVQQQRSNLREKVEAAIPKLPASSPLRSLFKNWSEKFLDREESKKYANEIKSEFDTMKEMPVEIAEIAERSDMLAKKTHWMLGGDGWAYDIGFNGVDHVLASGQNINCLVLDNENYGNTGGQASKATPRSTQAKFAMDGKATPKKDLGSMMMSYGNVYVAQTCFSTDPNHALKCIKEAEAYDGPSLLINYSPCINQGIKKGLGTAPTEIKKMLDSGYVMLYRYNPDRAAEGKNPLVLDSRPDMDVATDRMHELMKAETRFTGLNLSDPDHADAKHDTLTQDVMNRFNRLDAMSRM